MKKQKRGPKMGTLRWLQAVAEEEYPPDQFVKKYGDFWPRKKQVTLRVDADVLAWFRKPGRGYQTRINRVLRAVMEAARKRT